MRYSEKTDAVYCVFCVLFGVRRTDNKDKSFSINPVRDWSNFPKYVSRHTSSSSSHHGCVAAAEHYIHTLKNPGSDAEGLLLTKNSKIIDRNRHILKLIIDVIVLCGQQNIPLRGHKEEDSNFIAILHHTAKSDNILRDHLQNADPRAKYTSPQIQNELIQLCSNQIVTSIVEDLQKTLYFGFIADEATDASTMEQMAMMVRFFDRKKGEIREEFLGFSEVKRTTGEELANAFVDNLTSMGVNIDYMRGQGYDGASNMSGIRKGVQARISELVPGAIYTHCKAHCLNLVVTHACKLPEIRNMLDIVQQIAFAFQYSAKRTNVFKEELSGNNTAKASMERRTKLQTLCETRWASRANALFTFKSSLQVINETLDKLATQMEDPKARSYSASVERFDFIVPLVTCEHVLQILAPLSEMLQAKECDLVEAARETNAVLTVLQNERDDDMVWDALYETSVDLAASIDVDPSIPRRAGRQAHRNNVPADTTSGYWKLSVYYPFVDHVMQELRDRLLGANARYIAQYLVPTQLRGLSDEKIRELYDSISDDLDMSQNDFSLEIRRWRARWSLEPQQNLPGNLRDTLQVTNKDLYPGVYKALMLLLITMPVSTASAERSFSVMRRLKTYLRATMTTERLSGLALLHAHKDMNIDRDAVIQRFAEGKSRRLLLLFQV